MSVLRERLFRDDFLRHTGVMVLGTGLVNVFNLAYQLGLVRLLPVVEYGVLNALISLVMVASQFTVPFRPVLARSFATYLALNKTGPVQKLLKLSARDLGLIAAGIFLAVAVFSGPLAAWQQIEQNHYIILTGLVIAVATVAIVPGAFLWGYQRFTGLAALGVLPAFLKLLAGITLIYAGFGVAGALAGYIVLPAAALLIGSILVRGQVRNFPPSRTTQAENVTMGRIYRDFIPTGIALFAFAVLTNFDVILVKHLFSPQEAGYYSVAQIVGKMILFLPGAISIVIFPKAASARARKQSSTPVFRKGLLIVAAVNLAATAACFLAPGLILKVLTGKTDPESVRLVPWFALAMSFYALTWLNIFYRLSISSHRFIPSLAVIALLQTAAITAYHPELTTVLAVLSLFSVLSFGITLLLPDDQKL